VQAFFFGAVAEEPGELFGDLRCSGGRFAGTTAAGHGLGCLEDVLLLSSGVKIWFWNGLVVLFVVDRHVEMV